MKIVNQYTESTHEMYVRDPGVRLKEMKVETSNLDKAVTSKRLKSIITGN